jgi:hypothetical protein
MEFEVSHACALSNQQSKIANHAPVAGSSGV